MKCPSCKDLLSAQTGVCPSCGFVIALEGDQSLGSIIESADKYLLSIKAIKIFDWKFFSNSEFKLIWPLLTLLVLIIGSKFNDWFLLAGALFFIFSMFSFLRRKSDPISEYQAIRSKLEESIKKLAIIYGKDSKIKSQIQYYRDQIDNIEIKIQNRKTIKRALLVLIGLAIIITVLIPKPLKPHEKNQETFLIDYPYIEKAESLISNGHVEEVRNLLPKLSSLEVITEIEAKIQLKEIQISFISVEEMINAGNLEQAANALSQIHWVKSSNQYELELIEEKYYKQFVGLKNAINNKLPRDYRIRVESIYDFSL